MGRHSWKLLVLATVVLMVPAFAWGLINPDFTPLHLVDRSTLIVHCRLPKGELPDRVVLDAVQALKGDAPKRIVLDLSKAPAPQRKAAREILAAEHEQPLLLFSGKNERDESSAYLHAGGKWLRLVTGGEGEWLFTSLDDRMDGTWNGGTDMLLRCVRYILEPDSSSYVPVSPGTGWRELKEVGSIDGAVHGMVAVELSRDAYAVVHVASTDGDLLLRSGDDAELEDITKKSGLSSRSRAAAWADFDSDGRLDLASWDGKALTLWKQKAEGKFTKSAITGANGIPAECGSLTPLGTKQGIALVVGDTMPPLVLEPKGNDAFEPRKLTAEGVSVGDWGKPQGCLVADFDDDGRNDVILPFESNGLLFAGREAGGFAPVVECGVHCTKGGGQAAVGDFDGDGWLDIFSAGTEGVEVFQNRHDRTFAPLMRLSGELSYKSQPNATGCGVCDFNADGRQDVYITYAGQPPLLYFNRGFRSFGQSPELEGRLQQAEGLNDGQSAGRFVDLDADGAQDFIFVLDNGKIWCAFSDRGEDALAVQPELSPAAKTTVPAQARIFHEDRCLGAVTVRPGDPGYLGVLEAGVYIVKYRLDGVETQATEVLVEDRPVRVDLKAK